MTFLSEAKDLIVRDTLDPDKGSVSIGGMVELVIFVCALWAATGSFVVAVAIGTCAGIAGMLAKAIAYVVLFRRQQRKGAA
jgi:hypothetical protein